VNSLKQVEDTLPEVTAEKGGRKSVMEHLKEDTECDARLKQFKAMVHWPKLR